MSRDLRADADSVATNVEVLAEGLGQGNQEDAAFYGEIGDAEVEEAAALDLASFSRGRSKGFEDDAFEEWVAISRKHGNLTAEEIDKYLRLANGDDEEIAAYAADKLVRHNVKWIVRCLYKSKFVGPSVMNTPGDLRNDILSVGRMGFFMAITKYDFDKAVNVGAEGHRKSFLHYSVFWIDKMLGEYLNLEQLGLNDEAALDFKRIRRAKAVLAKKLGREPSIEEIAKRLEKEARGRLAKRGEYDPSPTRLRRAGALTLKRIKELLSYPTHKVSFDAPIMDGGEDAPTLGEYLEAEDRGGDEEREVNSLVQALGLRLDQLPETRKRWVFRMLHGLQGGFGSGRHLQYNPSEAAVFTGRSRDSILAYEEEVRRSMLGEEVVRVDSLALPGYTFTLSRVKALQKFMGRDLDSEIARIENARGLSPAEKEKRINNLRAEFDTLTAELEAVRAEIREALDLATVIEDDGVTLSPEGDVLVGTCPFEGPSSRRRTFVVEDRSFSCGSCGASGDVFEWIERRGLAPSDALFEAAWNALDMPSTITPDTPSVVAVVDEPRRSQIQRLR